MPVGGFSQFDSGNRHRGSRIRPKIGFSKGHGDDTPERRGDLEQYPSGKGTVLKTDSRETGRRFESFLFRQRPGRSRMM